MKISPETVRRWTKNLPAKQKETIEKQLGNKKVSSPIRQNRFTANKLESDFLKYLKMQHGNYPDVKYDHHCYKLKIGNGVWYEPDIHVAFLNKEVYFYEPKNPKAKGYQAGINKLKIAASSYPWHKFFLVLREGGCWKISEVLK